MNSLKGYFVRFIAAPCCAAFPALAEYPGQAGEN